MSRSKHQRHPTKRNKSSRFPHPYRHRKHKPYSLLGWCGWGGETYLFKQEMMLDIVDKNKARRDAKKDIESQVIDYIEFINQIM